MTSIPARDLTLSVSEKNIFRIGSNTVFNGTFEKLLSALRDLSNDGVSHLVITCNVDQTINLTKDAELRSAYDKASLITLDGAPLVAIARAMGATEVHRITGADLLPAVCKNAMFVGKKIAITGGRDDTLRKAVTNLRAAYPQADVLDIPFPMLSSCDDKRSLSVISALHDANPDIVFVCLGSPKQEAWYLTWQDQLPNAVYVGVGAAVDFAAGSVVRAPQWLQGLGLEWTHRLLQEPKRLAHRYLIRGMVFVPIVLNSLWNHLFTRRKTAVFEATSD
ncbi:UNVERIFIED_CONTAM: WecB/TagA/CpsF family glycosyltransferase [Kocuria sp. CPCC 205316]|uniref:WecB/TagA/CpsF family glycosyltransferase n=1 Tax=Kocuria TaxID=57493 RepID=UPI0036D9649D